jgi:hypothetical protein
MHEFLLSMHETCLFDSGPPRVSAIAHTVAQFPLNPRSDTARVNTVQAAPNRRPWECPEKKSEDIKNYNINSFEEAETKLRTVTSTEI